MRITVTFRPLRDGKAGGMFMTGKLEDGNVLTSAGAECSPFFSLSRFLWGKTPRAYI